MALKVSKNIGMTDVITSGNPGTTQHPIGGSAVETRYFLFNDSAAHRYENVVITPADTSGSDEKGWIQLAPDNAGSPGTFLAAGIALSMANISDNGVAKPFWCRVTSAAVGAAANKNDLQLNVGFREFAV